MLDPTCGRMLPMFLRYSIPTVLGMVALSSASIVDAMFLGHVVGAAGVATLKLATPIGALIFGAGTMLAAGGCVTAGKLLGAGHKQQASAVFSGILLLIFLVSAVLCLVSYWLLDPLVHALGARGELVPMLKDYLACMFLFSPTILVTYGLCVFARLDGKPTLAALALLISSITHALLDWLFIVKLGWGVRGAAMATGLAYSSVMVLLLPYFFSKTAHLRFVWHGIQNHWQLITRAIRNGSSEFANELSVGITTLLFNWVLMRTLGSDGVAAYAIVEFVVLFTLLFTRGICESVEPMISKNFGARLPQRIAGFFQLGAVAVLITSLAIALLLIHKPEGVVALIIADKNQAAFTLALDFIAYLWLACLFNGLNVLFASYLVAVHQAMHALLISLARSLIFPSLLILTLPNLLGREGLFLVLPLAEMLTFGLAIALVFKLRPSVLVARDLLTSPQEAPCESR